MKIEPRRSRRYLSEPASILLDVIRFSAAILVLIAHFTHPEFHLGYANLQILGDVAVPVFFVLSGFVIRYVTKTRESTTKEYFIDRASRIYSVVLPAMFFTLTVSAVCFAIDRSQFLRDWSETFTHPLARLMFNLVFISQAWGHNSIPFINSPFWSLGYECAYYLFYGLIFFLRGWQRILLCALVALVVGPQVIFLFPVWWLGCWVYDLYAGCGSGAASVLLFVSGGWLVVGAGLFVSGFRAFLLWPAKIFVGIAGLRNPIEWLGMPPMRATMFAVATGIFSSIGLLIFLLATDHVAISRSNVWARGFRHIADGTFAIYLMHYPFLVLLLFAGLLRPGRPLVDVFLGVGTCAVLIAIAVPIDKFKLVIRRWLRSYGKVYRSVAS